MRFLHSLLILGVIAASCGVSDAAPVRKIVPQGAVSFTSKEHRFAVWLPDKPHVSSDMNVGKRERILIYNVNVSTQTISYRVLVVTYPPSVGRQAAKHRLDEFQKLYLKNREVKLHKVTDFRLGRVQGREFGMSFGGTGRGAPISQFRHYSTPQFYYSLSASGTQADMQAQAAQIQRVFDSFRILPR